jgi:hypothetical protein
MLWARVATPRSLKAAHHNTVKKYCLTQTGPSRIGLLCECGKGTPGGRPVVGIGPQPLGRSEASVATAGSRGRCGHGS